MSTSTLVLPARLLAAAVVLSFAALVALPRAGDRVVVAVTAVLAVVLVGLLGTALRRAEVRRPAALATALGALAVAGAEAYLLSLPADGADIPLAGVGVLFLGLVVVVAGTVTLARPRAR